MHFVYSSRGQANGYICTDEMIRPELLRIFLVQIPLMTSIGDLPTTCIKILAQWNLRYST